MPKNQKTTIQPVSEIPTIPTLPKKTRKQKERELALGHLDLPEYFEPAVKISHRLDRLGINLEESVSYLRTNESEMAMLIVAYYDKVPPSFRIRIDLDDLIAAARVDAFKAFGLIAESYAKINSMEASMIAAGKSPHIMQARTFYAQQPDGHQDAKMILQATGNAPVPKNQVTTNYLIGNRIDNSKNVQVNGVPTLEDIVAKAERPLGEGDVPS